ncbi:MAG: putative virulence factor, partial [Prevotella sp.]|nr:putative virulence factor [Prevotella sp.]
IAPLFFIATKFNIDLERTKADTPSNIDKLDEHWNRFDTVIPEIIKPNKWMEEWIPDEKGKSTHVFQNIYPLRDFYWSRKNNLFKGYDDGDVKSCETAEYIYPDFPNYMECLRRSFLRNDFVQRHFANPEQTWNDVATINNDGSKAIIRGLDSIAPVIDDARQKMYLSELRKIKQEMMNKLVIHYEPENSEEKNRKVKQITGDIRLSLIGTIGSKPEIFGQIIDRLMVSVGDIRNIAYNIIICHTDTPKDFSSISFMRALVGINPKDDKERNVQRLCDYFACDMKQLDENFKKNGYTLEDVVSNETETLTTVADVVAKHIADFWVDYLNTQAKELETILPHANDVVFMLVNLFKKVGLKKEISNKIAMYSNMFDVREQPNVIADFASLTLNNFVSTVGRSYIKDSEIAEINAKAQRCGITINTTDSCCNIVRKPQPLLQTLKALDDAVNEIKKVNINMEILHKLPLWDNFQRWMNLVTIGLIYASDISRQDPIANAEIKEIIDSCEHLYQ